MSRCYRQAAADDPAGPAAPARSASAVVAALRAALPLAALRAVVPLAAASVVLGAALLGAAPAAAQPAAGVAPITRVLQPPDAGSTQQLVDAAEDDDDLTPGQRADPWEPFNRAIWRFNQDLDQGLILPWTDAYVTLVPRVARTAIGNALANLQDAWSAVNNLLQGHPDRAVAMTMRFATNSSFGLFGLIDIATDAGMPRTPSDFGLTLGVWGLASGPYLMLPLLGPSSVRDTAGLPLDLAASPYLAFNEGSLRPVVTVLGILNARAQLLEAGQALDEIALDRYAFVRDLYLRRRLSAVWDGNPPQGLDIDSWRRPAPAAGSGAD